MNLIRACFLFLAVLMPTTWTIAHAADPAGDSGWRRHEEEQQEEVEEEGQGRRHGRRHGRRQEVTRALGSAARHQRLGSSDPASLDRAGHPLGERAGAVHHDRKRAAHLQQLSGVRAQGRELLLLPLRRTQDPDLADVRGMAGRRAPLALRRDVDAGRQRPGLPGLHLPARRMARPGPAPRRRARQPRDGEVLPGAAQGTPAPGQAQRASADGVLHDALRRHRRCRLGVGDLEAGAAGAADAPAWADSCGRATGIFWRCCCWSS